MQTIAGAVYGDSALWYKLAEANGLSGQATLAEGTTLTLPAGVIGNANTSDTTRPYNPAEALGDLSPTTPNPTNGPKCGVFGRILLAVVAIAVTVISQGALGGVATSALSSLGVSSGVASVAGTAIGNFAAGALGSVASQGVGIATGQQSNFSFKQVGLAGLRNFANPVQLGGGGAASFKSIATAFGKGAASNAIRQGIGVAVGAQEKFSFKGVATAGLNRVAFAGGPEGSFPGAFVSQTAQLIAAEINRPNPDSFGDKQALPPPTQPQPFQTQPIIPPEAFQEELAELEHRQNLNLHSQLESRITGLNSKIDNHNAHIDRLYPFETKGVGTTLELFKGDPSDIRAGSPAILSGTPADATVTALLNRLEGARFSGQTFEASDGEVFELLFAPFKANRDFLHDTFGSNLIAREFNQSFGEDIFVLGVSQTDGSFGPAQLGRVLGNDNALNVFIFAQDRQTFLGASVAGTLDGVGVSGALRFFKNNRNINTDIPKALLEVPRRFRGSVRQALQSGNPGTRLEGQLAVHLGKRLKGFQRTEFRPNGRPLGDVDLEVDRFIIEAFTGPGAGKRTQVQKLINNSALNSNSKQVIVFAPDLIRQGRIDNFVSDGAIVVRTFDELDQVLGR